MTDLPFIDEHALVIDASPDVVWKALLVRVPRDFEGRFSAGAARLLGCAHPRSGGPRPIEEGSTFPGFMVAAAEPPRRLRLDGSHRFSRYRLEFALDDLGDGRTRLRAATSAEFGGPHGRAYRAAVIGSGGHVVVVRRMLAAVARRSIRDRP